MSFEGFGATGELPFGTLPDVDVGATGILSVYLSEAGHITESTEFPTSTYFESRVQQPISFGRSLFGRDGFYGRIAEAVGEIGLVNTDRFFDDLMDSAAIDGRRVVVRRRALGGSYTDSEIVFDGTAAGWESPEGLLRIRLRDNLWRLNVPVQNSASGRYTGAGGVNGGADLAGKPKPLAFGVCLNVPLVLVDAGNLIYQFHDGQAQAVDAVYDSGDELAATDYTVDLTNGRITLGVSPVGLITADVEGSKLGGSYVDSTAYIIRRIIESHVGLDPQYVDTQTFAAVDGATAWSSGTIGYWIGPEDRLAAEAIVDLLAGVGGFLDCDLNGRIGMGIFGSTWYGDTFEIDETAIDNIERIALPAGVDPPNKRRQAEYQRLWTGPQVTDLAGIVTAARRSFLALEARTAEATGTAGNSYIMATDPPPVRSFFNEEADAEGLADYLVDLYGVPRAAYRVTLSRGLFAFRMNMTGTLRYPAWNLHNGREARVFAIETSAAEGKVRLGLFV